MTISNHREKSYKMLQSRLPILLYFPPSSNYIQTEAGGVCSRFEAQQIE